MTEKEFLHQLRRGIGSAIVELRQSPDRDKYKELVLRCCLKDIGYDVQIEGTKGYYLYLMISAQVFHGNHCPKHRYQVEGIDFQLHLYQWRREVYNHDSGDLI